MWIFLLIPPPHLLCMIGGPNEDSFPNILDGIVDVACTSHCNLHVFYTWQNCFQNDWHIKGNTLQSVMNYVPPVPSSPTCFVYLNALRAHVPYVPACLCDSASYLPYVPSFVYVSYVSFFFYVPYVSSFCYVPYLPYFFDVSYVPPFFMSLTYLRFFKSPNVSTCLMSPHYFTCLTCLLFYMPYVLSAFFSALKFWSTLRAFTFLYKMWLNQ